MNWHHYLLFNIAIALSYLFASSFKNIFKNKLLQKQILKSVRLIFLISTLVMLFIPIFLRWFPIKNNYFELKPFIKEVSNQFLHKNQDIVPTIEVVQQSQLFFPSMEMILLFVLTLGGIFFFFKYLRNLFLLQKMVREAYIDRIFKKIHILFSHQTEVPFCFVSAQSYVFLPISLLENKENLRFAIRHELQHLRQKDGVWLHVFAIINIFCFWNPFLKLWRSLMNELQEFSCDEALVLRKNTSSLAYAQCLLDSSIKSHSNIPCHVLSFHSTSINRRITMLFRYQFYKTKRISLIATYAACFLTATSVAYALNNGANQPFTMAEVAAVVDQSKLIVPLSVTPEVVAELNRIRGSEQASAYMRSSLQRMQQYQSMIEGQLKKYRIPNELLVIPLVESGYQSLEENKNFVKAAGLWQIIPSTGRNLGLTITSNRDDRMNPVLSTEAAVKYLTQLHQQFGDWKLTIMAYEYGEDKIADLIKKVGSNDPWKLARSKHAPAKLNEFLSLVDASLIIMKNPSLIS